MTSIQAVVNAARSVFRDLNGSTAQSFDEMYLKLKEVLCKITPDDIGLTAKDCVFPNQKTNGGGFSSLFSSHNRTFVKYPAKALHVHEEPSFSILVFVLNEGERIPLHDHPGMNGLIKCLTGRISIRSFTPLPLEGTSYTLPTSISRLVPKESHEELIPCLEREQVFLSSSCDINSICSLFPSEGNIHEVKAEEGCPAFLDILSPPYDDTERDCHYYKIIGKESDKKLGKDITWMQEIPTPPDFITPGIPYKGPTID